MGDDGSAGLVSSLDLVIVESPDVPGFGENHAFWLFDETGEHHLNFHVETLPGQWRQRREHGYVTLDDGRVLLVQGEGGPSDVSAACSATTRLVVREPFARWTGERRGTARDTSLSALCSGPNTDGPRVVLAFSFDATMARPPWVQGAFSTRAREHMEEDAGAFIGGFRYEQLFRADVELEVGGSTHRFGATGVRTHRAGPRNLAEMVGHCWASALFPSGRAFGLQRYPRADGTVGFSEGWLTSEPEGTAVEATVLDAPWLDTLPEPGQRFAIDLVQGGRGNGIEAELVSAMVMTVAGSGDLAWMRQGLHDIDGLVLVQSMARFTWDGEEAFGLLERSALRSTLTPDNPITEAVG
jgi:hypothetical protein